MSLFQIDQQIAAIIGSAEESGELGEALAINLDALAGERVEKIDRILSAISEQHAIGLARKAESERLAALASSNYTLEDRLKKYVLESLLSHGEERIETARFKAYLQNNPPCVETALTAFDLPECYRRIPPQPDPQVDKKAIIEAWKRHEALPTGVTVVQEKGLRIK